MTVSKPLRAPSRILFLVSLVFSLFVFGGLITSGMIAATGVRHSYIHALEVVEPQFDQMIDAGIFNLEIADTFLQQKNFWPPDHPSPLGSYDLARYLAGPLAERQRIWAQVTANAFLVFAGLNFVVFLVCYSCAIRCRRVNIWIKNDGSFPAKPVKGSGKFVAIDGEEYEVI